MKYRSASAACALYLAVVATTASANDLYWKGGTADLSSNNYLDQTAATDPATPTASDTLYIGADGTATRAADLTISRLVIGHNGTDLAGNPGAYPGSGTVTVSAGTVSASYTLGTGAAADAGVFVGTTANGTLNIDAATVNVQETMNVGYGNDGTLSGTVNITNGGTLNILNGSLNLGQLGTSAAQGTSGIVSIDGGNLAVSGAGGDLTIGVNSSATFTQTGGVTTVTDRTSVGRFNGDNSSFTLNGGAQFTTGEFFATQGTVADGRSNDVTINISNATLTSNGTISVGQNASNRGAFNASTGAVVSGTTVFIGRDSTADCTLNLSGDATFTATGAVAIGANSATRAGWTMADTASATTAAVTVGNNSSSRASWAMSGSATAKTAAVTIGTSSSTSASWSVTGSAAASTGNVSVGAGTSNGASLSLSQTASVSSSGTITVGSGTANNAKLTVSGGTLTSTGNVFVGRGNSTNSTFTMTGGVINAGNFFLLGNGNDLPIDGVKATVLANHSGGTIRSLVSNVTVGDYEADVTYNVSGTAEVDSAFSVLVGRRVGTSVLNQTGGSVTAAKGVRIGDQQPNANEPLDIVRSANGTYQISAGTLTANVDVPTRDALSIGAAGTGTFRVVGQDATININGNITLDSTIAGNGTLAYRLEAGEGLSPVTSTGTATFKAGSALELDFNSVKPVQGVFNVLTAVDIINDGLAASIPAGWNYQIVPSTGGKTLRFIAGDFNADAIVNADDLVWIDRGRAMGLTGGANGDLNADGVIDAEDYQLIDQAYGITNSLSPAFLAARAGEFGDAYVSQLIAAVPEPTSLLAAGGLALPLVTRRRRSR